MSVELSIVIPLHNEEPNVAPLHEELSRVLAAMAVAYEIILDRRWQHGRDVRGAAASAGARSARARRSGSRGTSARRRRLPPGSPTRAAGSSSPSTATCRTIPRTFRGCSTIARTHDIVCGWRKDRKDDFLTRHVPSVIANGCSALVSGVRLHDNGCSLKVFRAEVVKPLKLTPGMHRYLPALASQLGGRVTEVVVNHRPRRFGAVQVRAVAHVPRASAISSRCGG